MRCEPATDGIDRADLRARIGHALRERTGISIAVELLAPGAVPRSEGKAVRVVDRRPADAGSRASLGGAALGGPRADIAT